MFAFLALSACVGTPQIETPAPAPRFDPLSFFSGRTLGTGKLRKILYGVETTRVYGTGRIEGGMLILDQRVEEGDKPAKHRTWRIREDSRGHYRGTLTDASGAVTGETRGNRLHLAFTLKGGLPTEQWLTLAADGRSAHNIMVVKKLGLRVAVLDEHIRKVD
ncbi:MAG: DUF3833 family protein [Sphingomonas sp.]